MKWIYDPTENHCVQTPPQWLINTWTSVGGGEMDNSPKSRKRSFFLFLFRFLICHNAAHRSLNQPSVSRFIPREDTKASCCTDNLFQLTGEMTEDTWPHPCLVISLAAGSVNHQIINSRSALLHSSTRFFGRHARLKSEASSGRQRANLTFERPLPVTAVTRSNQTNDFRLQQLNAESSWWYLNFLFLKIFMMCINIYIYI